MHTKDGMACLQMGATLAVLGDGYRYPNQGNRMTATWNLRSSADQTPVRLGFYAGRSGMLPNYETYDVRLDGQIQRFNNPFDADRYALSLGVTKWLFVDRTRALPFAALIPIHFDDAPDDVELRRLISRFELGESLQRLADELTARRNDGALVSAGLLRTWILGNQPDNSKLAALRPPRYRKSAQKMG